MTIDEVRKGVVKFLYDKDMWHAYNSCVKILKEQGLEDKVVELISPEQVLCIPEKKLIIVSVTLMLMPKILELGIETEISKFLTTLKAAAEQQKLEKELSHVDWNKEFFKN